MIGYHHWESPIVLQNIKKKFLFFLLWHRWSPVGFCVFPLQFRVLLLGLGVWKLNTDDLNDVLCTMRDQQLSDFKGFRRCYAQWSTSDYRLWLVEEGMLRSAFSKIWLEQQVFVKGRDIMIKHVLQAIPSYGMRIFLLSTMFFDIIEKIINTYWWGHGDSTIRGID